MVSVVGVDLMVIFGYATIWFLVALRLKKNDLADIAWGLGFIVVAGATLFQVQSPAEFFSGPFVTRSHLLVALVSLWGLRLSGYIFLRNRNQEEDFRYRKMRSQWGKNGVWRSYLQIFLMQGAILFVVGLPVWITLAKSQAGSADFPALLDWFGFTLALIGIFYEAVADYQMAVYRRDRKRSSGRNSKQHGQVLNTGLWRYSRHPNYFGEIAVWWGFYLVALSSLGAAWTAVGPVLITFLLLRVSGVPLLEKKYQGNPTYQIYQRSTNAVIPGWPRKTPPSVK